MMTALEHPLVVDYLDRLHAETVRLPVTEGRELEVQIREHLTEALPDEPTEIEVRDALDRLGSPAALVDEAGGASPAGTSPVLAPERSDAWREVGALVGLVGSAVLFFLLPLNLVLWLGGMVLLVLARRWGIAEKLWGAVVLGLSPWLVAVASGFAFLTVAQECSTDESGSTVCTGGAGDGLTTLNVVAIVLTVIWLGLYVWTLVRLIRAAARRDVVDYSAQDARSRPA